MDEPGRVRVVTSGGTIACRDEGDGPAVLRLQGVPAEAECPELVEAEIRRLWEWGIGHPERRDPEALEGYLAPWWPDPQSFFRAARAIEGKGLSGREDELAELDLPAFLVWG